MILSNILYCGHLEGIYSSNTNSFETAVYRHFESIVADRICNVVSRVYDVPVCCCVYVHIVFTVNLCFPFSFFSFFPAAHSCE